MYDYNSIYSENTYIRINEETVFGQVYYNDLGESSTYFFNMPELDMGDYPFTIHYDGNDYYEANDFEGTYHVTKTPLIVNIFPNSVKEGENGTIDVGLWQLNDYYLWTSFKNKYWFDNIQLDPFNWKHNTYIALHHMKYLDEKFKVQDDSIMAYNCGEGNVMNGTIPASTRAYLAKVKNNLFLLKGDNND